LTGGGDVDALPLKERRKGGKEKKKKGGLGEVANGRLMEEGKKGRS